MGVLDEKGLEGSGVWGLVERGLVVPGWKGELVIGGCLNVWLVS